MSKPPRPASEPVKFTIGKTGKNEKWDRFSFDMPVAQGYVPKSIRVDVTLANGRGIYGNELGIPWSGESAGDFFAVQGTSYANNNVNISGSYQVHDQNAVMTCILYF